MVTLALVEFSSSLDWMSLGAIGAALMRDLSLNPGRYAILVSAGSIAAGASGLVLASLIDRFPRRGATETLLGCLITVSLLTTCVENFWLLLVLRALAGICGAAAASQAYAMVADLFTAEQQPRAYAVILGGFSLTLGGGLPALVFLESHFGWHSLFLANAGLLSATWLLLHSQVPHLSAHPVVAPWRQLSRMLGHRPHQISLLLMSVVMCCGWMLIPFIAPYFVRTLQLPPAAIARLYLCAGITVALVNFGTSHLVQRVGATRMAFAVVALAIPLQWLLTHLRATDAQYAILIATLFYAASVTRWSLCNMLATQHIQPTMRGGMMSLSFALQESVGGLSVTLGGMLLYEQQGMLLGYERLGYATIGFNLILVSLIGWLARQQAEPATDVEPALP
ncbi:MAG: MFS transporter [Burkholderiales bacterium]|nr:MFS transporter [Burkholderiales bacterium]